MLIRKLAPKQAERFPAPFGTLLTFSSPVPGCGSAPHPPKSRGALRALPCQPSPGLLPCSSTEREWFHLCSTHEAPNTLVGLFPSSVGLCWKPDCPTAFCRAGDPWPAAAGTGGWAPAGPCCGALGSARGLFSGLLRRAGTLQKSEAGLERLVCSSHPLPVLMSGCQPKAAENWATKRKALWEARGVTTGDLGCWPCPPCRVPGPSAWCSRCDGASWTRACLGVSESVALWDSLPLQCWEKQVWFRSQSLARIFPSLHMQPCSPPSP